LQQRPLLLVPAQALALQVVRVGARAEDDFEYFGEIGRNDGGQERRRGEPG
jgi:hypothetical protein